MILSRKIHFSCPLLGVQLYKTILNVKYNVDYLGDDSKEVKIQMLKPHTVITVFFLQRVDTNEYRRADSSSVWVGNDTDNFSPNFIKIIN